MIFVGFTGKASAGKSTAAELFQDIVRDKIDEIPRILNFADPVKDLASKVFDIPIENFYFNKERIARGYGMTHRELLQKFGTDFARNMIDPDFWVKRTARIVRHLEGMLEQKHFIFGDVRFDNEARYIRSRGGIVILVTRESVAEGNKDSHESEKGVSGCLITNVIKNDSTKDALRYGLEVMLDTYIRAYGAK